MCRGALFDFVPTATSLTAQGNYGYLATNDTTPVTITLPPNLNIPVGSTVRVSGSGAAGWIIAQQTGQTILSGQLLNNAGINWRTNSSGLNLKAITSSADGRKLAVAIASGNIFTSADYGVNWSSRASALNWSSIASSADGTKLVASVNGAYLWTSTDSGTNWTQRLTSGARATGPAMASSSLDGNRIVACVRGEFRDVMYSTDSGARAGQARPEPFGTDRVGPAWPFRATVQHIMAAVAQGASRFTLSNNGGASGTLDFNRETGAVYGRASPLRRMAGYWSTGVNSVNQRIFMYTSTDAGATLVRRAPSRAQLGPASPARRMARE
jgi:hypothetical protein